MCTTPSPLAAGHQILHELGWAANQQSDGTGALGGRESLRHRRTLGRIYRQVHPNRSTAIDLGNPRSQAAKPKTLRFARIDCDISLFHRRQIQFGAPLGKQLCQRRDRSTRSRDPITTTTAETVEMAAGKTFEQAGFSRAETANGNPGLDAEGGQQVESLAQHGRYDTRTNPGTEHEIKIGHGRGEQRRLPCARRGKVVFCKPCRTIRDKFLARREPAQGIQRTIEGPLRTS